MSNEKEESSPEIFNLDDIEKLFENDFPNQIQALSEPLEQPIKDTYIDSDPKDNGHIPEPPSENLSLEERLKRSESQNNLLRQELDITRERLALKAIDNDNLARSIASKTRSSGRLKDMYRSMKTKLTAENKGLLVEKDRILQNAELNSAMVSDLTQMVEEYQKDKDTLTEETKRLKYEKNAAQTLAADYGQCLAREKTRASEEKLILKAENESFLSKIKRLSLINKFSESKIRRLNHEKTQYRKEILTLTNNHLIDEKIISVLNHDNSQLTLFKRNATYAIALGAVLVIGIGAYSVSLQTKNTQLEAMLKKENMIHTVQSHLSDYDAKEAKKELRYEGIDKTIITLSVEGPNTAQYQDLGNSVEGIVSIGGRTYTADMTGHTAKIDIKDASEFNEKDIVIGFRDKKTRRYLSSQKGSRMIYDSRSNILKTKDENTEKDSTLEKVKDIKDTKTDQRNQKFDPEYRQNRNERTYLAKNTYNLRHSNDAYLARNHAMKAYVR